MKTTSKCSLQCSVTRSASSFCDAVDVVVVNRHSIHVVTLLQQNNAIVVPLVPYVSRRNTLNIVTICLKLSCVVAQLDFCVSIPARSIWRPSQKEI